MSSAYSAMCVSVLMPSCKSFMNRTKSKGPKMDPWGTPDRTGFEEDLTPSNTEYYTLFTFAEIVL